MDYEMDAVKPRVMPEIRWKAVVKSGKSEFK